MDTESNQKTRRFTKIAWCKKRADNPRKKVNRRSSEARGDGQTGAASPNTKETWQVNPEFGTWAFAAALIVVVLLMGVR